MPVCQVENCRNSCRTKSSAYCDKHYRRFLRTGTTEERSRSYSVDSKAFDRLTRNKAWLMGLIWADGNLSYNRIDICSVDVDLLESAEQVLGSRNCIKPHDGCSRLSFSDERIARRLKMFGLKESKSLDICWPLNLPPRLEPDFVRGVFDGDGWVTVGRERSPSIRIGICSGSKDFAEAIGDFYHRNDISYHLSQSKRTEVWQVMLAKKQSVRDFYDLLYKGNPPYLKRKKVKIEEWFAMPRFKPGRPMK